MLLVKNTILIFVLAIFCSSLFGQRVVGKCSTVSTPEMDARLEANINYLEKNGAILTERATKYVPIRFTVVRPTSGTGGVSVKNIMKLLCKINKDYANQELQFFIKDDIKYLNNDKANTDPQGVGGNILKLQKDKDALNMFFVADIMSDSEGQILGFYSPNNDFVVIRNSGVNDVAQTASHELGHFFSLRHTFYGWECQPWNEADFGKTVTITIAPCPPTVAVELVNGSNCATAADRVCDTPPDYNFGFGWPNDCRYFDTEVYDRNDELIHPDQSNYMSYFFGCGDYHFSQGQINLIKADLASAARDYLKSTFVPTATTLQETINYFSPIDSVEKLRSAPITLSWEAVPGATSYILEYSKNKSFGSAFTTTEIVNENQFTIPASTFTASTTVAFWRVSAFNPVSTCNAAVDYETFQVVTALNSNKIDSQVDWSIVPNNIKNGDEISIMINTSSTLDVNISVTSTTGQKVINPTSKKLSIGENRLVLEKMDLKPGIYIISISNIDGISSKKLIVQ